MHNSYAPHAPVPPAPIPLLLDGGSPKANMGSLPSTFQPVNVEVADMSLLNNTVHAYDMNPFHSNITQAKDLDADMTPAKTRAKRKKEFKMEKYISK